MGTARGKNAAAGLLALVTTGALAVALLAAPPPATAGTGDGGATVVAPRDGSVHEVPWDGPVKVDFTGVAAGTYDVSLACPEAGYTWSATVEHDGSDTTYSWTLDDPVTEVSTCELTVPGPSGGTTTADFSLVELGPPAQAWVIHRARLSTEVLRPGSTDPDQPHRVVLRFTTGLRTHLVGTVVDASGDVVRRRDLGHEPEGRHAFRWWGHGEGPGEYVRPGTYRMRVVATTSGGSRAAVGRELRVRR